MTDFVIRGVSLNGFEEAVREHHGDSDKLCQDLNLPSIASLRQQEFIDYTVLIQLMNLAAEEYNNPYFGFLLSQKKDPRSQYGLLSLIAQTSSSLGEALNHFIRFLKLHTRTSVSDLRTEGSKTLWVHTIHYPGEEDLFQVYLHAMGIGINILRALTDDKVKPNALYFTFKEPKDSLSLRRLITVPIHFNASFNGLEIDCKELERPCSQANPELNQELRVEISNILQENPHDFVMSLKNIMNRALDIGDPSIERVANYLACNKRTLQRRLEKLDLNYKNLLDEIRLNRAKHYLQYSNLSLINIADLLDYNDQSSFSRFFTKQVGLSPLKWRKQHQQ